MKSKHLTQRLRALLWSCVILPALHSTVSAQTLVNEYSFNDPPGTTVADSIGGQTGMVPNGADGWQPLILNETDGGEGQYIQLPAGILSSYTTVTIDTWETFLTLTGNMFLFGFGNTDGSGVGEDYIFCEPAEARLAITGSDPGYTGEQGGPNMPNWSDETLHVTCVFDPVDGYDALYTNGVLENVFFANENAGINGGVMWPLSDVAPQLNYIARSLYTADTYVSAEFTEFRIWNGTLNPLEVAGCDAAGSSTVTTGANGGANMASYVGTLSLQLGVTYYAMSPGNVQFATVSATGSSFNGGNSQIVLSTGGFSFVPGVTYSSSAPSFVTVSSSGEITAVAQGSSLITATYQGKTASQTITVAPVAAVLTHRYSFAATGTANDSVGIPTTINGSVAGAATISVGPGLVIPNAVNTAPAPDYLSLPAGILTAASGGVGPNLNDPAVTIEAWTTVSSGQYVWANLFDFGAQDGSGLDSYSIHVAANANPSDTLIGISDGDNANNLSQIADEGSGSGLGVLFPGTQVHVTAVYNPPGGGTPPDGYIAIYENGKLVGKNVVITDTLAAINAIKNKIGADNWPDPGLKGSVAEFRIWNGALTSQEVAISDQGGPNTIPSGVTAGPGTLESLTLNVASTSLQLLQSEPLQMLATYSGGLTGWDLLGNSVIPPAGLTVSTSDPCVVAIVNGNTLRAGTEGSSVITAVYQGTTQHVTINVTRPAVPAAILVHEYSFGDAVGSPTAFDSVGGASWDGTLPNGGTFNGTGQLTTSTTGSQYVNLPVGVIQVNGTGANYSALTIEVWATASFDPVNSMLYAFGNTDGGGAGEDYIFGSLNRDYTAITAVDPGYTAEQSTSGSVAPLPLNQQIHFTGVYNPPGGYIALYTNGILAGINTTETDAMSAVSDAEAYLGHSVYNGDPYATLSWDEFRIYNGVLLPDEEIATQVLGPNVVLNNSPSLSVSLSGGDVVISWPAAAIGFTLQSTSSLSPPAWANVAASVSGGITCVSQVSYTPWEVSLPPSAIAQYFRLVKN